MKKTITSVVVLSCFFFLNNFGQAGITYDLNKPEKYENRSLGYEKTYETKFRLPRHFIQNSITHYNYYFNTNNKLIEIVNRAKSQFRDDFSKLLPFYNYTLDLTARDKRNLDSVIDKVNTAILVRDLRNDWVDNMYMLMGQAYYYRNNLDSAHVIFQFINYAFAPKEKDGYPLPIASNANAEEGGSAFAVSSNEKRNIAKRTFSLPPSRNESFIWQIRTYITKNELTQASVLIDILRHDPLFPSRLNASLHEMQALLFYKQNQYDSAALHLTLALDVAATANEKARWEYLIAQLYEQSGNTYMSKTFYEKSAAHTSDPVLEVYGRLNAIRQNKVHESGTDYIRKNIDALNRMSHKEIYSSYLDIIYYTAGEMELEINDRPAAKKFFKKSIQYATAQSSGKNRAFLKLGWLAMEEKNYKQAKASYDSVNVSDPSISDSTKIIIDRKKSLSRIVPSILIIERQDSLERIALMNENERNDYIKKLIRAIRKQQGLKEEEQAGSYGYTFQSNSTIQDLFSNPASGDWYFYNPSVKGKGFSDFKSKWGNRPNADNWQLQSLVSKQKIAVPGGNPDGGTDAAGASTTATGQQLNAQILLANLPLTPEKWKKSKDSIENALFALGKALQDYLPDYQTAIVKYDSLLSGFPATRFYQETLFNEYYCYKKLNDELNAARILELLKQKFPSGRYLALIENPDALHPDKEVKAKATTQYEKIYSDFIEGNFDQALAEKKIADSVYGEKYWTPQLLYIEALYFVHNRQDSLAKISLSNIIRKFSGTPMADKSKNMLNVLNRRKEIESYLTNLKIVRASDDSTVVITDNTAAAIPQVPVTAKIQDKKATDSQTLLKQKTDTAKGLKKIPDFNSAFILATDKPHSVALMMNKVDPVYVKESGNAFDRYNRETYYPKNFDISHVSLNDTLKLLVIGSFDNAAGALDYMNKAAKISARDIIPWLPATKYSFLIITDQNLDILKANKDINAYKKFLSVYFPGKF